MANVRVAIYSRVSTADQDNENQLAQLREYCHRQDHQIVSEYIDVCSGGKADRLQFKQMFEHASQRKFDLLLFWSLALETGARFNVVRTLQWTNVDFQNRCLRFGKDKTQSGTGRIVPLSPRAMATLQFWAGEFPDRRPEHFVFPHQRYGGGGKKDNFGFTGGMAYDLDPTRPLREVKEAWERAKLRAAKILKGISDDDDQKTEPLICRFHDLRHTAVSRMLDAGIPLTKVAKIVGWSTSTMVAMAARYGHFTLDELRGEVATISKHNLQETSTLSTNSDYSISSSHGTPTRIGVTSPLKTSD